MPHNDTPLPSQVAADSGAENPQTIGFLLIPGFSLMSYASAVEPFRAANRLATRPLYDWRHVSIDGEPVRASNGTAVVTDHRVGDRIHLDALFVCAGGNPSEFDHRQTFRWLQALAREGILIGGISGGPYILAKAGLLAGRRCTIHWEHLPAFVERFPELKVARTLYVIDGDRLTCAGGIAALDLMHALIARNHGRALAAAVSEWFLHTDVRAGSGPQRWNVRERFNLRSDRLVKVLEHMEINLEEPSSREDLASIAGTSVRQLERLFRSHLNATVREHYLRIRLDRAHSLVSETNLPILDIAVACGFVSASHFSRAYKEVYGAAPKAERKKQAPATRYG